MCSCVQLHRTVPGVAAGHSDILSECNKQKKVTQNFLENVRHAINTVWRLAT